MSGKDANIPVVDDYETLHNKLRSPWNGHRSISFLKNKIMASTDEQQTIYIISSQSTKYFLDLCMELTPEQTAGIVSTNAK